MDYHKFANSNQGMLIKMAIQFLAYIPSPLTWDAHCPQSTIEEMQRWVDLPSFPIQLPQFKTITKNKQKPRLSKEGNIAKQRIT